MRKLFALSAARRLKLYIIFSIFILRHRLFSWFGCLGCLPKDPNHNLQERSGLVKGKFQCQVITLLCKGLY